MPTRRKAAARREARRCPPPMMTTDELFFHSMIRNLIPACGLAAISSAFRLPSSGREQSSLGRRPGRPFHEGDRAPLLHPSCPSPTDAGRAWRATEKLRRHVRWWAPRSPAPMVQSTEKRQSRGRGIAASIPPCNRAGVRLQNSCLASNAMVDAPRHRIAKPSRIGAEQGRDRICPHRSRLIPVERRGFGRGFDRAHCGLRPPSVCLTPRKANGRNSE